MNDETRDIFVTGLKNAHAMENQALSIMKPQLSRIENYPEVAAKLEQHIRETEGQIVRIEDVLASLNEDHSFEGHGAFIHRGHGGDGTHDGGRRNLKECLCQLRL